MLLRAAKIPWPRRLCLRRSRESLQDHAAEALSSADESGSSPVPSTWPRSPLAMACAAGHAAHQVEHVVDLFGEDADLVFDHRYRAIGSYALSRSAGISVNLAIGRDTALPSVAQPGAQIPPITVTDSPSTKPEEPSLAARRTAPPPPFPVDLEARPVAESMLACCREVRATPAQPSISSGLAAKGSRQLHHVQTQLDQRPSAPLLPHLSTRLPARRVWAPLRLARAQLRARPAAAVARSP